MNTHAVPTSIAAGSSSRSRHKSTAPGDDDGTGAIGSGAAFLCTGIFAASVNVSIKGVDAYAHVKNTFTARLDVRDKIVRPSGGNYNGTVPAPMLGGGTNANGNTSGPTLPEGGVTLTLDRVVAVEESPLPEPNLGAPPSRQRMYLASSAGNVSSSDSPLEALLAALFDRGAVALGSLSCAGMGMGTGTGSYQGQAMVALYAVGRDRGLLVLQGWRERPVAAARRPDAAAGAQVPSATTSTGTQGQGQQQRVAAKDRHNPSSRYLLQFAANAQFEFGGGATLDPVATAAAAAAAAVDGRDMDDSCSAWAAPPPAKAAGRSVGGEERGAGGEAVGPQPDVSFDFSVSASGFDAGHSDITSSSSETNPVAVTVAVADKEKEKDKSKDKGKPSGLFQSVMGAVAAAGAAHSFSPRSSPANATVAAAAAAAVVVVVGPAVQPAAASAAASTAAQLIALVPTPPTLSAEEDAVHMPRVQKALTRLCSSGNSSSGGEKASKHAPHVLAACGRTLESCLLHRAVCPAAAAAAIAAAVFKSGWDRLDLDSNSRGVARDLSTFRRVVACLQPLGEAATRNNRSLGLYVAIACALRTLLALELVRRVDVLPKASAASLPPRLQEEVALARQVVGAALERLMLVTRLGQLVAADLAWLFHVPAETDSGDGASKHSPEVSGDAGPAQEPAAPVPAAKASEAAGGEPSSLAAFLASCGQRFASSSLCQDILLASAEDVGLSSGDSAQTPSPTLSKRRAPQTEGTETDQRSVATAKDATKRPRIEALVSTSATAGSYASPPGSSAAAEADESLSRDPKAAAVSAVDDVSSAVESALATGAPDASAPSRVNSLKRTNSILFLGGAGTKTALSQRTNGAQKRQVTIAAEKPQPPSVAARAAVSMPPPPPLTRKHVHTGISEAFASASPPLPPHRLGGMAGIILDTPQSMSAAPASSFDGRAAKGSISSIDFGPGYQPDSRGDGDVSSRGGSVSSNRADATTSSRDNLSGDISATSQGLGLGPSQYSAVMQTPRPPRQRGYSSTAEIGGLGSALHRREASTVAVSRGLGALGALEAAVRTPLINQRATGAAAATAAAIDFDRGLQPRAVVANTPQSATSSSSRASPHNPPLFADSYHPHSAVHAQDSGRDRVLGRGTIVGASNKRSSSSSSDVRASLGDSFGQQPRPKIVAPRGRALSPAAEGKNLARAPLVPEGAARRGVIPNWSLSQAKSSKANENHRNF